MKRRATPGAPAKVETAAEYTLMTCTSGASVPANCTPFERLVVERAPVEQVLFLVERKHALSPGVFARAITA
jgi:hypothetical protein